MHAWASMAWMGVCMDVSIACMDVSIACMDVSIACMDTLMACAGAIARRAWAAGAPIARAGMWVYWRHG